MLLIDNIYYLFCCLLRKDKKAQEEDSWRVIGGAFTDAYLSFSFFLFFYQFIGNKDNEMKDVYTMITIYVIIGLLITLRYTKYLPFHKLEEKLANMNKRKRKILNILTALFLLAFLPLSIICFKFFK